MKRLKVTFLLHTENIFFRGYTVLISLASSKGSVEPAHTQSIDVNED